jgi:hypothetical protein
MDTVIEELADQIAHAVVPPPQQPTEEPQAFTQLSRAYEAACEVLAQGGAVEDAMRAAAEA